MRAVDCEMDSLPGAQLDTDGYHGQDKVVVDEDRHVIVGASSLVHRLVTYSILPL